MPEQEQDEQTVAGAVAKRDERTAMKQRLDRNLAWFDDIMPSHMPARQMIAMAMGEFRKIKDLREAAEANPASFLAAVAECARLGLVPGDTGFFIPYYEKEKKRWTISFLTHWRGEVELIHRTGEVETVVAQAVREHDYFRWVPNEMRLPEHHIPEGEGGQVGLAAPADRGLITGVYCYVRFKDGGTSFPTVMHSSEVRKHYDKARSKKFWGEWGRGVYHQETTAGAWTEDMFRKTAIHKHSDSVPKSPEYLTAKIAQQAKIAATMPAEIEAAIAAQPDDAEPEHGGEPDFGNGDNGRPSPRTIVGAVESSRQGGSGDRQQRNDDVRAINGLFIDHDLGGDDWREPRLLIIGAAASEPESEPIEIRSPAQLTAPQAARALTVITGAVRDLTDAGRPVRAGLLSVAAERGWTGEVPDEGEIGTRDGEPADA